MAEVLRRFSDKMAKLMSTDLPSVRTKSFTKALIPSLSSSYFQTPEEEATIIVDKVIARVEVLPDEFQTFVAVLKEIPSQKLLAEMIEKEYEKFKLESQKTTEIKRETELPSHSDTNDNNQEKAPALPNENRKFSDNTPRFPYLNDESLTEPEREWLKFRLKSDSDKQQNDHAVLVDKTRESLEIQKVTCKDLSVLVRHSTKNQLYGLTKNSKSIKKLFVKLADYWSFFDYELLKLFIDRYCPELQPDLISYESQFKDYCRRRLCELPADIFASKINHKHNLYVKIDSHFHLATGEYLKNLQHRLSVLLEIELYVLKVEEGCIFVTFTNLCTISTPLSPYQVKTLKEMKILHLYSDTHEYFSITNEPVDYSSLICGTCVKDRKTATQQLLRDARELAVSVLSKFDCDPSMQNESEETLLHSVCIRDLVQALEQDFMADVNLCDEQNNTPLHVAALNGHVEVVLSLVQDYGFSQGHLGRTPLHMASLAGHKIGQYLLKFTSPLVNDDNCNTALHLASEMGHMVIVRCLFDPVLIRNSFGQIPKLKESQPLPEEHINDNRQQMLADYEESLQLEKKYSGLLNFTRVFVIGHPGSGKSSFFESLKKGCFFQSYSKVPVLSVFPHRLAEKKSRRITRTLVVIGTRKRFLIESLSFLESFSKVSESSVPPHTAGIIPSVHMSSQYGRVLFYDFAGDFEYYFSHAAIFESLASSRKGDNIFIIVVDLRKDEATMSSTLHYWFSFKNFKEASFIVGSHLDQSAQQIECRGQFCTAIQPNVYNFKHFMLDFKKESQEYKLSIDKYLAKCHARTCLKNSMPSWRRSSLMSSLKREHCLGLSSKIMESSLPETLQTRKQQTFFCIDMNAFLHSNTLGETFPSLERLHQIFFQDAMSRGISDPPGQTTVGHLVCSHLTDMSDEDLGTSLPDTSQTSDCLAEQGAQSSDTKGDDGSVNLPTSEC